VFARAVLLASLLVLVTAACGPTPSSLAAAPAARAAYADGRFVLQGRPTFVLGVYDTGLGYSLDFFAMRRKLFDRGGERELSRLPGLNLYLNYQFGRMPLDAFHTFLDVLHRHRVTGLATGNCFEKGSWRRYGPGSFSIMDPGYVRQIARHPALFGYYIMDECRPELLAETQAHHRELKALDPSGLTIGAVLGRGYADPAPWLDALDILMTDPYPLYGAEPPEGYPHHYVADQVARLRAVVPPERPIVAVLQLFKFTTKGRLPTYAEMRTHAVMAIVEGAQGILWWELGVNGLRKSPRAEVEQKYRDLGRLTGELHELQPALVAPEVKDLLVGNSTITGSAAQERMAQLQRLMPVVRPRNYADWQWYKAELDALQAGDTSKSYTLARRGNVRTLVKAVGGRGYVLAYNYTHQPLEASFTWRDPVASVSRDGATLPVDERRWSDRFGPYEAHVYVVTPR